MPEPGQRPLVSIVVAVMNGARTLERCLDSIAAQTHVEKELVIKDGGSTDETCAILERRRGEIAFWASEKDRGIYDAWNSVLDRCRGEWICFLGCDDEFADPTSLAAMVAQGARTPRPDLVCGLAVITDESGRFVRVFGRPWSWPEMKFAQRVAHPGMLHRAELFARHGHFDPSFKIAGDYEFLLRVGPEVRAEFVDRITVRLEGAGMSRRLAMRALKESWRAQAKHPEIGTGAATLRYGIAVAKLTARRLLGQS